MTAHAHGVIYGYVYGFVLAFNRDTVAAQAQQIIDRAPLDHYPHAAEQAEYALHNNPIEVFESGLDLILDGLDRALSMRL